MVAIKSTWFSSIGYRDEVKKCCQPGGRSGQMDGARVHVSTNQFHFESETAQVLCG